MKIQTNSSKVNRNITNARFDNNTSFTYEANARNYGQIAGAVNQFIGIRLKEQEDKDAQRVVVANNEYERRINELKQGIFNDKQLGNAADASAYFEQQAAKIQKDVYANAGIKYQKGELAFKNMATKSNNSDYNVMQNYEREQMDKYYVLQSNKTLTNSINKTLAGGDFAEGLRTIATNNAVLFPNKTQDYIDALNRKQITEYTQSIIMQKIANKQFDEAKQIMDEAKPFVDNSAFIKSMADINEYEKANTQVTFFGGLYSKHGDDLAGALREIEASGKSITVDNNEVFSIPISQGDNPDLDGLKPELKAVLPNIGGVLQRFGLTDGALVTSGYRDEERNSNAGGAKNSYHLHGDAVDIYIPAGTQEQRNELQQHLGEYFTESMFHDAGTGMHLHLGGYKGGLGKSTTQKGKDPVEIQEKKEKYTAFHNQQESLMNREISDRSLNMQLDLFELKKRGNANETDLLNIKNKYTNSSSDRVNKKISLEFEKLTQGFLNKPEIKHSDMSAVARLIDSSHNKTLTTEMVWNEYKAGNLKDSDFSKFFEKAAGQFAGKEESINDSADKLWIAKVKEKFPKTADAPRRDMLITTITQRLNDGSIENYDRYDEATKMLQQEKDTPESITNYYQNSSQWRQGAVDSWGTDGEKIVALIEQGVGRNNKTGFISGQRINEESTRISRLVTNARSNGDSSYDTVLRGFIDEGVSFTYEDLINARNAYVMRTRGTNYSPVDVAGMFKG